MILMLLGWIAALVLLAVAAVRLARLPRQAAGLVRRRGCMRAAGGPARRRRRPARLTAVVLAVLPWPSPRAWLWRTAGWCRAGGAGSRGRGPGLGPDARGIGAAPGLDPPPGRRGGPDRDRGDRRRVRELPADPPGPRRPGPGPAARTRGDRVGPGPGPVHGAGRVHRRLRAGGRHGAEDVHGGPRLGRPSPSPTPGTTSRDTCLNGVGLSPAYVAGILEAGDSAGEHRLPAGPGPQAVPRHVRSHQGVDLGAPARCPTRPASS